MDVVLQRVVGAAMAGSSLYEVVLETSEEFKQWLEKEVGMTSAELGGEPYFRQTDIVMKPTSGEPALPAGIQYLSPQEIFGDVNGGSLFIKGDGESMAAHYSDVNQGELADAWLMSALAMVARYGKATSIFTGHGDDGVVVQLHKFNKDPKMFGTWDSPFEQPVTYALPTKDGKLCYTYSDEAGELWPALAEKAVAAAYHSTAGHEVNGYEVLLEGNAAMGLAMLLGGTPFTVKLNEVTDAGNRSALLFRAWKKLLRQGCTVIVYFKEDANGLEGSRPYTVFSLQKFDGALGPTFLALFRSPRGKQAQDCAAGTGGVWNGKWSDCDADGWAANPQAKAQCDWNGRKDDGTFWMAFEDIVANLGDRYTVFIPSDPELRKMNLTDHTNLGLAAASSKLEGQLNSTISQLMGNNALGENVNKFAKFAIDALQQFGQVASTANDVEGQAQGVKEQANEAVAHAQGMLGANPAVADMLGKCVVM
uniref:Calpain catalytic domain-containing protein n=1 Tax=Eutreptiella gymnastica TaxID=73025 RepID=A0A6U8PEZ2_9EUGL